MRARAIALLLLPISGLLAANPQISSRISRTQVESSATYNKHKYALEIEFRNGAVYRYLDVPTSIYHDLMTATSKAGYYDNHIRHCFHSVHVKLRR